MQYATCSFLHLRMSPAMMARRSSWSPQAKRASESTPRSMAAAIQASKASPRRSRTRVKKAWLSVSAHADGPWERVHGERCDSGGCPASAARRSWVMKRPTVRAEWGSPGPEAAPELPTMGLGGASGVDQVGERRGQHPRGWRPLQPSGAGWRVTPEVGVDGRATDAQLAHGGQRHPRARSVCTASSMATQWTCRGGRVVSSRRAAGLGLWRRPRSMDTTGEDHRPG